MRMKKNLITITKHPSTSCYVEEGTKAGTLHREFVRPLLSGGRASKELAQLSFGSFYVSFHDKRREEQDEWVRRLKAIRIFACANMV